MDGEGFAPPLFVPFTHSQHSRLCCRSSRLSVWINAPLKAGWAAAQRCAAEKSATGLPARDGTGGLSVNVRL